MSRVKGRFVCSDVSRNMTSVTFQTFKIDSLENIWKAYLKKKRNPLDYALSDDSSEIIDVTLDYEHNAIDTREKEDKFPKVLTIILFINIYIKCALCINSFR